jgi:hypothetical protein
MIFLGLNSYLALLDNPMHLKILPENEPQWIIRWKTVSNLGTHYTPISELLDFDTVIPHISPMGLALVWPSQARHQRCIAISGSVQRDWIAILGPLKMVYSQFRFETPKCIAV